MSDISGEQLSALLDDEVGKHERELVVRRLLREDGVRERWARYQLISETLRNQAPDRLDPGFAARVMRRLEAEPALAPSMAARGALWRRPAVGVGLAASLALVTVVMMRGQGEPGEAAIAAAQQAPEAPVAMVADGAPGSQPGQQADWQAKLNEYLVNHNEYASMASVPGVLPYVRMVGYDTGR